MVELFRFFGITFFLKEKATVETIHIKTDKGFALFEVSPLKLLENNGVKTKDIYMAESIILENEDIIERHWKKQSVKQ